MGWISVKDRLPENDDSVLATIRYTYPKNNIVEVFTKVNCFYNEEDETWYFGLNGDVIGLTEHEEVLAWMPIPEPYKGCENND